MSSKNKSIQPPKDIVSKPCSVVYYAGTVNVWLTFRITSSEYLEELENTTLGGIKYFDGNSPPAWYPARKRFHMEWNPMYIAKVTIQGPTSDTFMMLHHLDCEYANYEVMWNGKRLQNVRVTRVDVAEDYIFSSEKDAIDFMRYINSSITKKYHGKQSVVYASCKAGSASDSDKVIDGDSNEVRYTGKHQVSNKIVTYFKEQCPVNGKPAAHIECRIIGSAALKRSGITSVLDLWGRSLQVLCESKIFLKGIDDNTMIRIGKIVSGETSSRKQYSEKYRSRMSESLPSVIRDSLSSYKKIGNGFIRGSFKLYGGEVYLDVQDVIDRLKKYGKISNNISQYFPDVDVSVFDHLPATEL